MWGPLVGRQQQGWCQCSACGSRALQGSTCGVDMRRALQVLAGLYATAAALGLSNEAFLTTFNKSVPTALGLLGEYEMLDFLPIVALLARGPIVHNLEQLFGMSAW